MKIYIYRENCTLAGQRVPASKIEAADDPECDMHDWDLYDGNVAAILAAADEMTERPNHSPYQARVARVLRDAAEWAPDYERR